MAISQSQAGDSFSFDDFQKLLSRPYITPSFLAPANVELNEFYLGPFFNNAEAVEQTAVGQLFPCTQGLPFLNSLPLGLLRENGICTWPKSDVTFRRWHACLVGHGPTKALVDNARISDLLEISIRPPTFDSTLFSIALSFWFSEYNNFIFRLGPMSITLRDVGVLVNLPPLGDNIFPSILVSGGASKFGKNYTESYSSLQTFHNPSSAKPSHTEGVAFLLVWLCKYVLCVPSIKPSLSYLPITHELARDRPLNLCSFFFGCPL